MKRALVIVLCASLMFALAACDADRYKDGYSDGYTAARQEIQSGAVTPTVDYVLNMNTKKFHYPDCQSVNQMSEKNKYYFTGTREEAIAMGYSPCGRCKP